MPPMLISLSPELLYRILGYCSRSDLVALSQVNRVLQHSSEYILYRDIFVSFIPIDLVKYKSDSTCELVETKCLFHTLVSPISLSKAQLLRFLHIQFEYDIIRAFHIDEHNKFILSTICSFLPHAPKLVDLRIMIDQHTPVNDYSDGDFSDALSATDNLPNLETLYIDAMNDIPRILEARTSLKVLGVHMAEVDSEVTSSMEDIFSILIRRRVAARAQVSIKSPATVTKPPIEEPIVFLLETPRPLYRLSYLTFVPALYLPGSAEHVCRQVVKSLAQDLGSRYATSCEDVVGLQLCLTNISEGGSGDEVDETNEHQNAGLVRVKEMMEAFAKVFPHCTKLKIKTAEDGVKPWRFRFFISAISQLTNVFYLTFYLPLSDGRWLDQSPLESFIPMLTDLRSFVVDELIHVCPKMDTVVLISCEHNAIMEKKDGWKAVIRDNDILSADGWRGHPEDDTDEDGEEDDSEEDGESDDDDDDDDDGEEEDDEEEPDMVYVSTIPSGPFIHGSS